MFRWSVVLLIGLSFLSLNEFESLVREWHWNGGSATGFSRVMLLPVAFTLLVNLKQTMCGGGAAVEKIFFGVTLLTYALVTPLLTLIHLVPAQQQLAVSDVGISACITSSFLLETCRLVQYKRLNARAPKQE